MTVSYLMPFTPGGIGIREGLYLITLGPIVLRTETAALYCLSVLSHELFAPRADA